MTALYLSVVQLLPCTALLRIRFRHLQIFYFSLAATICFLKIISSFLTIFVEIIKLVFI